MEEHYSVLIDRFEKDICDHNPPTPHECVRKSEAAREIIKIGPKIFLTLAEKVLKLNGKNDRKSLAFNYMLTQLGKEHKIGGMPHLLDNPGWAQWAEANATN